MPCIGHFRSQTYHSFDRYRLLYKPLGWTTILLVALCPAATTYTVFSFRGRWQAPYCTGYNLAVHSYWWQHISGERVVTRNILFPVVLGINFLQTHGGIISFPTNQLYLTTSAPTPADQPINTNHIYNTYTPLIHAPTQYHSHLHVTVTPNHPYHVINTAPVIIPARTNTIMTIPCTLPCSGNYLFEPSAQNFADYPVHCTPVIINAANDNLPVHFISQCDRDVVVPKHTYFGAMEKVQESNRDNLSTNATLEQLVNMHYLNVWPTETCYPANANPCIPYFKKIEVSSDPALLISPAPHLYNITLTLVMLNPSNNERKVLATLIVRKSKSKWKKCYATVPWNLVLALGLVRLC